MGVSNPTNFVHQVHVGFDPISGAFTGMPEQWTKLLTASAITKEDYVKNPQAVLDVLKYYTDVQQKEDQRDPLGQPARFGAGTGLGGQQRQDSLNSSSTYSNGSSYPSSTLASNRQYSDRSITQAAAPPAPEKDTLDITVPSKARTPSPRPDRADLVPQRKAPTAPAPARTVPEQLRPQQSPANNLRPLASSGAAKTKIDTSTSSSASSSAERLAPKAAPTAVPGTKPLKLSPSATKKPYGMGEGAPVKIAPKPANGNVQRLSKMSEAQIYDKLRSVTSPADPNTLYQKIKKVGQGASGSVYVAKCLTPGSTGKKVAIKQMDLAAQPRKELIVNEILVMKESQHPNIVNFLDSFLIKSTELWVVMEFMEGGALTDVIDNNTLEEDQISSICYEVSLHPSIRGFITSQFLTRVLISQQTCKGLQHLHAQSIIHRDIKSDNVLLDAQGHVKISEFVSRSDLFIGCGLTFLIYPSSRLWFLCQAYGSKVQASHDGRYSLLDGA
jgi:hypothetical protein